MSVLHQLVITIQVENTLVQMLAGCLYVLKKEGCSLVGGHTSEGMECAMGLSVSDKKVVVVTYHHIAPAHQFLAQVIRADVMGQGHLTQGVFVQCRRAGVS